MRLWEKFSLKLCKILIPLQTGLNDLLFLRGHEDRLAGAGAGSGDEVEDVPDVAGLSGGLGQGRQVVSAYRADVAAVLLVVGERVGQLGLSQAREVEHDTDGPVVDGLSPVAVSEADVLDCLESLRAGVRVFEQSVLRAGRGARQTQPGQRGERLQ